MKKFVIALMVAATCFAACEPELIPEITVEPNTINAPFEGKAFEVNVKANCEWVAVSDIESVQITPASGNKDGKATVTVAPNILTSSIKSSIHFYQKENMEVSLAELAVEQVGFVSDFNIEGTDEKASAEGGIVKWTITSNCPWELVKDKCAEKLTFNIEKGDVGTSVLEITVPSTLSDKETKFDVVFSLPTTEEEITVELVQSAFELEFNIEGADAVAPSEGGTITWTVTSNCAWMINRRGCTSGLSFDLMIGDKGTSTLNIKVPANNTKDAIEYTVSFLIPDIGQKAEQTFKQDAAVVEYGGVCYPFKKMADGRIWMTKNMQYVPEGKTVSADGAENAGIWYPIIHSDVALTDKDSVDKYGYLYDAFTALKFSFEDVNEDNYKTIAEGNQGICPEGWHIPTNAEWEAFVNAYYDEDQKGAAISKMEADGFNPELGGMRMQSSSKATGNYLKTMYGYFMSSTGAQYKASTKDDSYQYMNKGLMKLSNAKFQRFTVANATNFGGVNVRCIKDEAK